MRESADGGHSLPLLLCKNNENGNALENTTTSVLGSFDPASNNMTMHLAAISASSTAAFTRGIMVFAVET